ncbi:protein 5NUC-like [Agrilus planipennis]|uniref:5'-nucleotidase n=1 Tax=Agrilus planipennis TaxID=224129 RepID=A0A1W4WTD2_AGRPL|nr:protein 5NUC [Agrilus planipennis]XP_025837124.1 protein 5NUC-like [Agrilus planipennis]
MMNLRRCSFFLTIVAIVVTETWAVAGRFDFLILHTNDMHARFEETSRIGATCSEPGKDETCVGGFARVAHVVRQARKKAAEGTGPKVLFLNAGDSYTGTAWFTLYRWNITTEFMNLLQPDVMCLGNHEFDDRPVGLAPFLEEKNFPVVTTNIDVSMEPELKNIKKSHVVELDGHKIGVVGYLTPQTMQISSPGNVMFEDEVSSLRRETEILASEGVNIIIALGHSGYEIDKKVAAEVPLVDVVVGGHTDTFQWNGPQVDIEVPVDEYPTVIVQESGKRVPVVQAFGYTKYIGRLNVSFDEDGNLVDFAGQPLLLDSTIPREEDVLRLLDVYRPDLEELQQRVVGKTKVLLDGSADSCRVRECNLGNLITDAFVAYFADMYQGSYWTNSPIAVMNGGGVRNSIEPNHVNDGNVTMGELLGVAPFDNQVISLTLKGSDLIKTLEIGVRARDGSTSGGEFLQVSGLHVVYDLSQPSGSRVINVKALCGSCKVPTYETVQDDKEYRVVTQSFLTDGGDGHYILKDNSYNRTIAELNDVNVIAWYMTKNNFVYQAVEERIRFKGGRSSGRSYLTSASSLFVCCIFMVGKVMVA